jgi:hypothetical protein
MITVSSRSRQPARPVWTRERLEHERAIAIGSSIDASSAAAYSSASNSYITFCNAHGFPIEPTVDTLSFYTVYMSSFIKPTSVDSYLSGICNQLEPFFPNVRTIRRHHIVQRTLRGCKKMRGTATVRKRPLTRAELSQLQPTYANTTQLDDMLFFSMLLTGFHGLLRLGELAWPDKKALQDYRKVVMRSSIHIHQSAFEFLLPGHKGDRFFEGNRVIIQQTRTPDDPHHPFCTYLAARDQRHPWRPELWLRSDGSIPTRSWFMQRLHTHFAHDVGGHSMRAGGATALAEAGIPPDLIQAIGRWSSEAFKIYVRQHPVLLAALLFTTDHRH